MLPFNLFSHQSRDQQSRQDSDGTDNNGSESGIMSAALRQLLHVNSPEDASRRDTTDIFGDTIRGAGHQRTSIQEYLASTHLQRGISASDAADRLLGNPNLGSPHRLPHSHLPLHYQGSSALPLPSSYPMSILNQQPRPPSSTSLSTSSQREGRLDETLLQQLIELDQRQKLENLLTSRLYSQFHGPLPPSILHGDRIHPGVVDRLHVSDYDGAISAALRASIRAPPEEIPGGFASTSSAALDLHRQRLIDMLVAHGVNTLSNTSGNVEATLSYQPAIASSVAAAGSPLSAGVGGTSSLENIIDAIRNNRASKLRVLGSLGEQLVQPALDRPNLYLNSAPRLDEDQKLPGKPSKRDDGTSAPGQQQHQRQQQQLQQEGQQKQQQQEQRHNEKQQQQGPMSASLTQKIFPSERASLNIACDCKSPAEASRVLKFLGSTLRSKADPFIDVSVLSTPLEPEEKRVVRGTDVFFPDTLYRMLEDAERDGSDVIKFLPHGRAFRVNNVERFVKEILPRYFSEQTKWSSFSRQVRLYGFSRVSRGPDYGSYYHELFLRGRPELVRFMRRVGAPHGLDRRTFKLAEGDDPDFYSFPPLTATATAATTTAATATAATTATTPATTTTATTTATTNAATTTANTSATATANVLQEQLKERNQSHNVTTDETTINESHENEDSKNRVDLGT